MKKFKVLMVGALLIGAPQVAKGGDFLIDMWQNSSKIDKMERMGKALEDIATPHIPSGCKVIVLGGNHKELQEQIQKISDNNIIYSIIFSTDKYENYAIIFYKEAGVKNDRK